MWVLGMETGSSGRAASVLYLLSHLSSPTPGFYVGHGASNSDPHACGAYILLKEPSLPQQFEFRLIVSNGPQEWGGIKMDLRTLGMRRSQTGLREPGSVPGYLWTLPCPSIQIETSFHGKVRCVCGRWGWMGTMLH